MPITYTATPDALSGGDVLQVSNPQDGEAATAASNNAAIVTIANRIKGLNDLLASSRSRQKLYLADKALGVNGAFVHPAHGTRSQSYYADPTATSVRVRWTISDIPYRAVITGMALYAANGNGSAVTASCYAMKVDSLGATSGILENGGSGQNVTLPASTASPGFYSIPLTATAADRTLSNASGSEFLLVETQFTGLGGSQAQIHGLQISYTIIGP